jgi:hypothetical protein
LKSSIYFLGVLLLALSEIRASWWDENSNPESWAQARESLGNQLRQKLQKEGPAALKPGSSLEKEYRLWQWLGEWPEARGVDPIIFAELGKNQELMRAYLENIQQAASYVNSSLFRPPYGQIKWSQLRALSKQYKIVMWSWLSYDFDKTVAIENVINSANSIKGGDILVFHDNLKSQERVKILLPKVVDLLSKKGFDFDRID